MVESRDTALKAECRSSEQSPLTRDGSEGSQRGFLSALGADEAKRSEIKALSEESSSSGQAAGSGASEETWQANRAVC